MKTTPIPTDAETQKLLLRAFRRSASRIGKDKQLIKAESFVHLIKLPGGRLAQVAVSCYEYSPALLKEQPDSGGLLIKKSGPCKLKGVRRLYCFAGAEPYPQTP